MESFEESGMTFGPYEEGRCFRVEQSRTYQEIQDRVKMAEFLLIQADTNGNPPRILIVEAKKSSPKPETQPNFTTFVDEIRSKLTNALSVGIASMLNRHPLAREELPNLFKELDLATTAFRLVLIINGHHKDWLQPLQDALRSSLHETVQAWALGPNAIAVINHEDAKRFKLISAP